MSADRLHLMLRYDVAGFSLDIEQDLPLEGVTALFGPSGSGKSTLLRLIAGLERPRAGRIALGSSVWFDRAARIDVPAHRRRAGLMFQDARLFPHLTVAGNLAFAAKRARAGSRRHGMDDIIAAFALAPLLERHTDSLSGGERQRVALARTLLSGPDLLLLDEPLAALDAHRKGDILPFLDDLPRRFGVPVLYVSHDLGEVSRLADRIVVLREGRIEAEGAAAAIIGRLDLDGLAGRLEAGTLLSGRVTGHDPAFTLTHVACAGAQVSMPMKSDLAIGAAVRLRILARDVALATHRPEGLSIRNVLPARVTAVHDQAGTAFAEVFLDLDGTPLRARVTRAAAADLALEPGMSVFALIRSVSFDGT